MTIQLENEHIQATINEHGAELSSLKRIDNDLEYVWQANPTYWKRHAPVLFPIVGKVVNNEYKVNEKTYTLNQHGFARDMKFEINSQSKTKAVFSITSNEQTKKVYPYDFKLEITYTLDKNRVYVAYTIANTGTQAMHFSIGAHPGFNCPLVEGERFEDYYFEFETKETASITPVTENGLLKREKIPYLTDEKIIPLTQTVFKHNALIFDHLDSTSITLKSKKSTASVRLSLDGFPFLGLWTLETGAPFVCVEPWVGHADYEDFAGDFSSKEDQVTLDPNEQISKQYYIEVTA